MEEPLIGHIPTIKKTLDDIRNVSEIRRMMPLLRPLLRLMKVDVSKIDEALAGVADLRREAEELASLPDRFNDLFSDHGWIIYEQMSVEVAKAAVERAEAGDLDGAEADLVAYFNAETIRRGLMTMHAVRAFRPRMRLAEKAADDYEAERYHSCVPIVLALMDGMVNELHERVHQTRRGISAEGVNLVAWDSFAAHSRGLARLVKILQTGRHKTTTDPISLPYRNGIMHGIDLGFDNQVVAAKTWATLFAVREWALRVESDRVKPPHPEPPKTWKENLRELQESAMRYAKTREATEKMEQWRPRVVEVGGEVPRSGSPEDFAEGSPERCLAEYLDFWRRKNYGHMARCISPLVGYPPSRAPGQVRAVFSSKQLVSFEFRRISDEAPAITEIETELVFSEAGEEHQKVHRFRLGTVDAEGELVFRDEDGASWSIFTWGV